MATQKLQLEQNLTQKLSGQQIQFVKLLQVPTSALNSYIAKEVAENLLLDEGGIAEMNGADDELTVEEEGLDPFTHYYTNDLIKRDKISEPPSRDRWAVTALSLQEKLREQLYLRPLNEVDYIIGEHIIGSLDQNGYLACSLEIVVQDLHVMHYLKLSLQRVEQLLMVVQSLDPPGIAARNLKECLAIQLRSKNQSDPGIVLAQRIINQCFDFFIKKHYDAIIKKLSIVDKQLLKDAVAHIAKLDPKPGWRYNHIEANDYLTPDFIIVEKQGKLATELIHYPMHKPRFNRKYLTLLESYTHKPARDKASREMIAFLKKKLLDAKSFMEALCQRNQTLLKTMHAILQLQYTFFIEGEETIKLHPMILQDVADRVGMDTSTVSRIVNQKSVQGRFGIYPLKFFFSEGISSAHGEIVSNKAIKSRILELIHSEDKQDPYSDESMQTLLVAEGYQVARRTVAKYREQLKLPVARLRKILV